MKTNINKSSKNCDNQQFICCDAWCDKGSNCNQKDRAGKIVFYARERAKFDPLNF